MTSHDAFGQTLVTWLHEEAEHRVPDHLGDVLVRTVATRQRKWWTSPERWLPVDTTTRFRGRIEAPRALVWLAVLLVLLLAVVGTAILTGALRPAMPLTGLATNGRIYVVDGTTLKSFAADGTDPKVVLDVPAGAAELAASPDGTHLAMHVLTGPPHIDVVRLADAQVTTMPTLEGSVDIGSPPVWSPTGDRLVYLTYDLRREHLVVASADGSAIAELPVDSIDPALGLWSPVWSPDGEWIAFIAGDRDTELGTIYLMRPDGKDLHAIDTLPIAASGGLAWSPDPTVRRLLYERDSGGLQSLVYDLGTSRETMVDSTFWPVWSPDGNKISVWGTKVLPTADAMARRGRFAMVTPTWIDGHCQDHPEMAGKSYCGPASWSPDGTRLIAPDISGDFLLSVMADGSNQPILIRLDQNVGDRLTPFAWQPIRP